MAHKKGKGDKTPGSDGHRYLSQLAQQSYQKSESSVFTESSPSFLLLTNSEAYAAKALRELHQNKEIEGRVAGKQTVYHALQDSFDDSTPEVIAGLDQEIKQLQGNLTALKANEQDTRAELATLCTKPLLSDLRRDIGRLDKEKESTLARLEKLRGSSSVRMPPGERAKIENEWKCWQKCVNIRRQICRDFWTRCSEVVPEDMTRDELWV
ncbi:hypothetical protein AWENTII_012272 [Aspergillus wentii]